MDWKKFHGEAEWYDDCVYVHCPCGDHVHLSNDFPQLLCETCEREYHEDGNLWTRGDGNGKTKAPPPPGARYCSIYFVSIGA